MTINGITIPANTLIAPLMGEILKVQIKKINYCYHNLKYVLYKFIFHYHNKNVVIPMQFSKVDLNQVWVICK